MNKLKTKIALAGLLFAAAGSSAFAQYDPNLANRYPGYAEPNAYGYVSSGKLGALNSEPEPRSSPRRFICGSMEMFTCSPRQYSNAATSQCRPAAAPISRAIASSTSTASTTRRRPMQAAKQKLATRTD